MLGLEIFEDNIFFICSRIRAVRLRFHSLLGIAEQLFGILTIITRHNLLFVFFTINKCVESWDVLFSFFPYMPFFPLLRRQKISFFNLLADGWCIGKTIGFLRMIYNRRIMDSSIVLLLSILTGDDCGKSFNVGEFIIIQEEYTFSS